MLYTRLNTNLPDEAENRCPMPHDVVVVRFTPCVGQEHPLLPLTEPAESAYLIPLGKGGSHTGELLRD